MVGCEQLRRARISIPDDDLVYYPFLQHHHISRALSLSLVVPQLPSNTQLLPLQLSGFTDGVLDVHRQHLSDAGLAVPSDLLFCSPSWPLIAAALERWNPDTHTFFFGVGELTLMLEEVPLLLGVPADPSAPPTYQTDLPDLRTLLRRLTHDETVFDTLARDGRLSLRQLWAHVYESLTSPVLLDRQAVRFGLLLLVAGLYLFPSPFGHIDHAHVSLMVQHLYGERGSLAQPALAHLYAGMDSAATGGPLFGSPFLLSQWLQRHFSFGTQLSGSQTRVPTRAPRPALRRMFDQLSDGQVTFSLPEVTTVLLPTHARSECVLVGAAHFVVYSAHRCTRQFSSDFRVPHHRGHVPRVEQRTYTGSDTRRAQDARVHWECHTLARGTFRESGGPDLAFRQRRYLEWMDQHTVSDLGIVTRAATSQGIPVPAEVPSFGEFGRRPRRRR